MRALVLIALALLTAGCDDAVGAELMDAIDGTYVVESVEGTSNFFTSPLKASGTLTMQGGDYTLDLMVQVTPQVQPHRRLESGTYTYQVLGAGHSFVLSTSRVLGQVDASGRMSIADGNVKYHFTRSH